MTEETRQRQRLAMRTKALVEELMGLEEVCGVFVQQATQVGCAAKDLRLELDPEVKGDAFDGS